MSLPDNLPFISVIIPVKNSAALLTGCLKSLNRLKYPKDRLEIILSDSDSRDATRQIGLSMGAKVIDACGDSVCAARNSAFRVAKGDLIAISDADCVMDEDWLYNSVKYFADESIACVGGPSLTPEDETPFGKAAGFIFSFPIFTGGSTYGLDIRETREVSHNPGCNAIYRRSAMEKVMPVSEEFFYAEDIIMNRRLKDLGCRFLHTPDTKVWHYRSPEPKRFFRQNFRYAIGRLLAGRADKRLLKPLHVIAGFGIPIAVILLLSSLYISFNLFLALILSATAFLAFFFIFGLIRMKSVKAALNVPYVIILLFSAWSLGFMQEFFFPTKKGKR